MKIYTFSEKYESYKIHDYIKEGDHGPWFDVVPKQAYDDLLKKIERMKEIISDCEPTCGECVEAIADGYTMCGDCSCE